jgi:hypothetical protein
MHSPIFMRSLESFFASTNAMKIVENAIKISFFDHILTGKLKIYTLVSTNTFNKLLFIYLKKNAYLQFKMSRKTEIKFSLGIMGKFYFARKIMQKII